MAKRPKTLQHAARLLLLGYVSRAAGTALEARAEPTAHRKEATTAESTAHEHDGKRDAPRDDAAGDTFAASSSTEAASMIVENAGPFGSIKIIT